MAEYSTKKVLKREQKMLVSATALVNIYIERLVGTEE